jgi:ribosomal protein S18 acetylase RimI-like enzyme
MRSRTQACAFYERHGFKAGKLGMNKINNQPNVEYHWSDR